MPTISFDDKQYQTKPGESILDCLTRHGVSVNYSCRAGVCQTCMMVAVDGVPTAESQVGLKDTLKLSDHFLICACVPKEDMTVATPNSGGTSYETKVLSLKWLSEEVIQLRLARPEIYHYLPGQFLNLSSHSGVSRSYSLASVPEWDDFLELQIQQVVSGHVSGWVTEALRVGDAVKISQALGQCSYSPGKAAQSLLLVGTGTGLSPLIGIAKDALKQGHTGPIHLYHGSRTNDGLYLNENLTELESQYPEFHYHPCVSRETALSGAREGRAAEIALGDIGPLSGWRVFICGQEKMVKTMQKKSFLAGAAMQDIFADPFLETDAAAEENT